MSERVKGGFTGLPTYCKEDLDRLNFAKIKRYENPKSKAYGLPKYIQTRAGTDLDGFAIRERRIPVLRKTSVARKLGVPADARELIKEERKQE